MRVKLSPQWKSVYNKVLRILETNGEKVTGGWRQLHNEELHNVYSFPNIIKMIKSRE
jgi:hypothetical protein